MRRLALLAVPFLALAGCASDSPSTPDSKAPVASVSETQTPLGDNKSGIHVPPMMRDQPDAAEMAKLTKDLDGLKKGYESAKATYEKNPKDKKASDAFVVAAVKYGHESMMSPVLEAKVKYRQALSIYREVLKIDPNNEVAKPETEMIESIYESMHRPVPK